MQTVNFKCGHCGNLMGVGAEFLGRQVRCPHCQQVVIAPADQGPPPEQTLPPMPPQPAPRLDETSILPPPQEDDASIFSEANSDSLLDEPKMPPLELSAPAKDLTLPLDLPKRPPAPALDYQQPPTGSASPRTEVVSEPEIPDWMAPATPGPMPTTNGVIADMPAPTPPTARRSSVGLLLFISLVFMPLVLYSVLVTILALLFYNRNAPTEPQIDPREYLIDTEGDHPGAKKTKTVSYYQKPDARRAATPLPAKLQIKLGESIVLGDLFVQTERVELGTVKIKAKKGGLPELREALILRLHLENRSQEVAFYPMDAFFMRKSDGSGEVVPWTVLVAGDKLRFFGGPAIWSPPAERYDILDTFYNQELKPGETMDTFVCTDGPDPRFASDPLQRKFKDLLSFKGTLVWHVQVRQGLVRWKEHDYPSTAVFGVAFTDADVKKAN